mmetsp:Transcript_47241/g.98891  ORF Transcript_47241/g.98891 Transcript_47241/m.98891 type:complete len:209 (-) Transcript_47241:131-757(-)
MVAANIFAILDGSKRAEMCMLARLLYGLMASVALIHLHLFVFAIVPVHLVVLGLGLQAVYIGLIQKMPKIKLLSPLPLVAIVGLYIQKLCWFVHLGLNDEAASAQISLLIVSCVWVVPIFMFALANKLALDELAADIESPRENQLEASVDYWEGMSSSKLIQSFGHRSPLGKIQSLFKGKENGSIPRYYTRRSSRKDSCQRSIAVVRH